jgi:putative transposase
VEEVCRKLGISQQTFYRRKKKYAGVGVADSLRILGTGMPKESGAAS